LRREFDAVLLATGAEQPRDLRVPGRELGGIHFAMDFLTRQNRVVAGDAVPDRIVATGKRVVILGGGDTGADCLGTCHRQGAASVDQLEIQAMPPASRDASTPWPMWPHELRTESSHEEGGSRGWSVATTRFSGEARVEKLHFVRDSVESSLDADLVLLAMGFTGPVREGAIEQLGVELDGRGNIAAADFQTSVEGVFAAGDARRGQSLIVWAIAEGRRAAAAIDGYLAANARE
jgi:glutamate synthase (NADPH/NADH) small chain